MTMTYKSNIYIPLARMIFDGQVIVASTKQNKLMKNKHPASPPVST